MYQIRKIETKDKEAIFKLIDAINASDNLGYSLTDEWFDYAVAEAGEHMFIGGTAEGQLVALGTCMIDHVTKDYAQVNVMVHPDHRQQGLGDQVMQAIVDHVATLNKDKNRGYAIKTLEAMAKKRLLESMSFIEKHGFKPAMYSWEMSKSLDAYDFDDELEDNKKITATRKAYKLRLAEQNPEDTALYIAMMAESFGHEVDAKYYEQIFQDPSIKLYYFGNKLVGGTKPVGMLAVQYRDKTQTAYLFDIAINEKLRRRGLGSAMIIDAIEIIRQAPIQAVGPVADPSWQKVSLSVDGVDKGTLELYKKLGFTEVDEDVIMTKMI